LIRRPDLAYKAHTLAMVTAEYDANHDSFSFTKSFDDDQAEWLIQQAGQKRVKWSVRVEDWRNRLKLGDGHAWGGLILTLVPRLNTLIVDIRSRDGLEELDDVLYNMPYRSQWLTEPYDGNFDVLLDQLEDVSSTLSVFCIDTFIDLDWDFLGFIARTTGMNDFKCLKSLTVP
jgi:hypothetical protein